MTKPETRANGFAGRLIIRASGFIRHSSFVVRHSLMPEPSTKAEYVVGIDLGGTKILAGLFNGSLECIGTAKVSTKAQRGMETVISRIERCVRDAVDEADLGLKQVAGVGIGAPGAVDFET